VVRIMEPNLDKVLVSVSLWHSQKGNPLIVRLRRGIKFPMKSLVYLFSKFVPFITHSDTFFGSSIYHKMPEHFYFYFFGFFVNNTTEAGLTRFLIGSINKGDTVLDVGANCGLYTLLLNRLVGTNGAVHSFEPTKKIFDLLKKSTSRYENIYINNIALFNTIGPSVFYTDESYSVANSIERTSSSQTKSEIMADTLDNYCTSIAPDFIKLDAEGSEMKILLGGLNMLREHSPTIAMEVLREVEEVGQSASKLLIELGYSAFRIEDNGELSKILAEDLESEDIYRGEGFINILFKKVQI